MTDRSEAGAALPTGTTRDPAIYNVVRAVQEQKEGVAWGINTGTCGYLTGDCLAPRTIQAAVLSGHQVARDILSRENKRKPFKREQTIH